MTSATAPSVDLSTKFGGTMYVGFTGGTAGTDADQRITSFSVTSAVPEADTYAMLLAGLGLVGLIGRRRKSRLKARSPKEKSPMHHRGFFFSDRLFA
jgi:MYXO-CTERM domain-containing protein